MTMTRNTVEEWVESGFLELAPITREIANDWLTMDADLKQLREKAAAVVRLEAWIDDLQSGMYINCVYCGHRYGPREDESFTMRETLHAHIEQCPEHPLSHAKADIARLHAKLTTLREKAAAVVKDWNDSDKALYADPEFEELIDALGHAADLPKRAIELPNPKGPEVTP